MKKDIYDLTNPQKAIYLTEQFYKGTSIGNVGGTLLFKDKVNFPLLERALNVFVEKNDAMRIKMFMDNSVPKQYVEDYCPFNIDLVQITNNTELKELEDEIISTPFNIFNSFLFKFTMVKFPDGTGGYNANFHHMITDAWSMKLFIDQIVETYYKLIHHQEINVLPEFSYIEYINREQEYINSDTFSKAKEYWAGVFDTVPELATLSSSTSKSSLTAKRESLKLSSELTNKIKEFCSVNKTSPFILFVAIFSFYLSRITGLDEIVTGTPILNRANFREKNTAGMFISTMPFKVLVNQELLFLDYLNTLSKEQLTLFRHQKYHYDYIIEDIRKKHNISNGLYDILISYQNARNNSKTAEIEYSTTWQFNGNISDSLDIHIYDMDDTGEFTIYYDYLMSHFSKNEIVNLHDRILHILSQILGNSEIKLQDIEIVSPKEKQKLLYEFNNTKREYGEDPIHVLIEKQSKETPDRTAIVFKNTSLTYQELNEKSNSIAHLLREHGVKQNTIVGIMVNRSLEMLVGILGILKAGGAYIPIDPEYPEERITYMLENSNSPVLLSQKNLRSKIHFKNILDIDLCEGFYNSHTEDISSITSPRDIMYLIYTSGSTGKPKGVMLTHRAVSNLTNYCNHYIEYLSDDQYRTIVSVTTVSFDIFIFETLISLQKGLKVVIANEDEQVIPELLNKLIEKHQIQIIQTTPSRMQLLVNDLQDIPNLSNLKYITLAGEQYPITLANELKKISKNVKLYNGYGPSETTVFSTLTDVTDLTEMTIGKPLDNTQIYILKENNLCPINVPGEIYISGDGIGLGYINNEELTKKGFIQDIFNEKQIMYKSGDLGYYREDGQIVCLGRIDNQVKIRGLRIELGEIEQKISEFPNILNCVVVKKTENCREFLCGYYTSSRDISIHELREYLLQYLPTYMVPQYFTALDKLPYTPNGKIDRKKLPNPTFETRSKEKKLPRNELDSKLLTIFENLLKSKDISIDDSILDLGGDSLTMINMCTNIYKDLSLEISVKEFLELQTIEKISNFLKNKTAAAEKRIEKAKEQKYYPISEQQKGMYLASKKAGDNLLYNMPICIAFEEKIDVIKFKNVINELINRHSALRTSFIIHENEIMQQIDDTVNIDIEEIKVEKEDLEQYKKDFAQPFILEEAPLLRVQILEVEEKHIVLLDIHHTVCDGRSAQILLKEIETLYAENSIEDLKLQYTDYAVWQKENKTEERKLEYNPLDIFYDYSKQDNNTYNGNDIHIPMSHDISNAVKKLAKDLDVTPYIFFLTIYFILLSRYSNAETITVASASEGRTYPQLDNILGVFVKNLILRDNVNNEKTFKEYVNILKDIVTKEIDESEKYTDSQSTSKLFDTMFLYYISIGEKLKLGDITGRGEFLASNTAKCDFLLQVTQLRDNFQLDFEYNTNLLKEETAKRMLAHYMNILSQIIDNTEIILKDIEIVTKEEKHKLLFALNNTKTDYEKWKTITQLFEEQVIKTPNNIALVCYNKQLTYKELNEKANSLAYYLRQNHVKNNDVVGIMVERSLEMIVRNLSNNKSGWYIFANRTIIS